MSQKLISKMLSGKVVYSDKATVRDALNGALFITADRMTQSDQRRMRLVLKKIGFQKDGVYKDKVRRDQARYVRKMG